MTDDGKPNENLGKVLESLVPGYAKGRGEAKKKRKYNKKDK